MFSAVLELAPRPVLEIFDASDYMFSIGVPALRILSMSYFVSIPSLVCAAAFWGPPVCVDHGQAGNSAGSDGAGPATKITNLGAVKIVLGVKRFGLYLTFTILYALGRGWLINFTF